MLKILRNDASASLCIPGVFVIIWVGSLTVAGSTGLDAPQWFWYALILIPGYGLVRGIKGLVKRSYFSLVGIIINLILLYLLFFASAWGGFGPG